MSRTSDRPSQTRSRPWAAILALSILVAVALAGMQPASAGSGGSIGDQASYGDGAPAAGIQVDLYEATSPWQRSHYVGSARTDGGGKYQFRDVPDGCYIVVFIAPSGLSFGSADANRSYDQIHTCLNGSSDHGVDAVLYRSGSDTHPPTTKPPTTHPPTTTPPTTKPPTTQPPTTRPPRTTTTKPERCFYDGIKIHELFTFVNSTVPGTATKLTIGPRSFDLRSIPNGIPVGSYVVQNMRSYLVANPNPEGSIMYEGRKGTVTRTVCYVFTIEPYYSPIALDLDGSGSVDRIGGQFDFDFDGDGETEAVSEWFAPTEGILIDTRIGGELTGLHLFGDQGGAYPDGYAKLARLDADGDGEVSGSELIGLAIWVDANSNAQLDPGERTGVAAYEIVALSTTHRDLASEAVLTDGSVMVTQDLWFPGEGGGAAIQLGQVRLAALGLLGLLAAAIAARRRKESLDDELAELVGARDRSAA